jgi:hypothetical protein
MKRLKLNLKADFTENIESRWAVIQLMLYEPYFGENISSISTKVGDHVMMWCTEKHLEKFRVIYIFSSMEEYR